MLPPGYWAMSGRENPPAFPFQHVAGDGSPTEPCNGMSLLDHFAGQALAGEMTRGFGPEPGWQEQVAWRCYSVARAMLAAREKGGDA